MGPCSRHRKCKNVLRVCMWITNINETLKNVQTLVLKSSEKTPLTALHMGKLVVEAGFPPGVINILSGFGPTAGEALAMHMDVKKIAFTGSTAVGRKILECSAKSNLKKVSLELGGKSPNIVFDDADLDAAVNWASVGIFFNHGQGKGFPWLKTRFLTRRTTVCTAGSRLFVQEGIYDAFMEKFKAKAASIKVGNPMASDSECSFSCLFVPYEDVLLTFTYQGTALLLTRSNTIVCGTTSKTVSPPVPSAIKVPSNLGPRATSSLLPFSKTFRMTCALLARKSLAPLLWPSSLKRLTR